jgi:hypothetical protein
MRLPRIGINLEDKPRLFKDQWAPRTVQAATTS